MGVIVETTGDLFTTDAQYIAHGCNAQGVMGSGVAKIVRERYPKAYLDYVDFHENFGFNLGFCQFVDIDESRTIINIISQDNFGTRERQVSYDAIDSAWGNIQKVLIARHGRENLDKIVVAIPMIGAGLGGGNWNIIKTIIQESPVDFVTKVYYVE